MWARLARTTLGADPTTRPAVSGGGPWYADVWPFWWLRRRDSWGLPRRPPGLCPPPAGYPITGVDVSYYQGPSLDWAALAAGGARFAYIRASEQDGQPVSHNNPDSYYAVNYAGARANGLYTGAYHRARPDLSSGRQQADVLLNFAPYVADGRSLPPMLDVEWPRAEWALNSCYNLTPAQLVTWIRDFVTEIAVRTGRQAMIYTNTNWWNSCTAGSSLFAANPLFIANYSQNPPPLPPGWASFTFWQHAAGATIPGSAYSTPDQDVFQGDHAALARLLGGPATGLLATVNNRYVTAENAGASALIANRAAIGPQPDRDRLLGEVRPVDHLTSLPATTARPSPGLTPAAAGTSRGRRQSGAGQ
ncbi:hypothetical protein DLE60_08010 [Micromonospora globispora]|uniref:Lysozyme n=1 Tax=Micromonospora globispora TaxID=1450148 RepID=A0A317K9F8_9ACTN|nr:hypothetical protein DLJ46_09500 [Micromonospora globispora]PWU61006.1 hypothetical protein DLE60_08010 [Micromonospora globispora]RQW94967.1 hypothetical protein DKL51_15375 [Micromonospora globispora]